MNNVSRYGFRLHSARSASGLPAFREMVVATAQTFPINGGAATPSLRPGDLVRRLAGGGAGPCDGNEGAGGALGPYGVVMGIGWQWSAALSMMIKADKLASGIAWGTDLGKQSKIIVCPVELANWEVDVDDIVTATTEAAYTALIGSGADHRNHGAAGEDAITPKLDISTVAQAGTEIWRIVGLGTTGENRDYSGANVKLIVQSQVIQEVI